MFRLCACFSLILFPTNDSVIDFDSLTPELKQDVIKLQKRLALELTPLALELSVSMQEVLETQTHKDRLRLLKSFAIAETHRLETKQIIQELFGGADSSAERVDELHRDDSLDTKKIKDGLSRAIGNTTAGYSPESQLLDWPDAFQ